MILFSDLVVSSHEAWRIVAWCEVQLMDVDWQLQQWKEELDAKVSV